MSVGRSSHREGKSEASSTQTERLESQSGEDLHEAVEKERWKIRSSREERKKRETHEFFRR